MVSKRYLSFVLLVFFGLLGSVCAMDNHVGVRKKEHNENIEKKSFKDIIDDVLLVIFSFNDLKELANQKSLVCRKWENIVNELLKHRRHERFNFSVNMKFLILPKYEKSKKKFTQMFKEVIPPMSLSLLPITGDETENFIINGMEDKNMILENINNRAQNWWRDKRREIIADIKYVLSKYKPGSILLLLFAGVGNSILSNLADVSEGQTRILARVGESVLGGIVAPLTKYGFILINARIGGEKYNYVNHYVANILNILYLIIPTATIVIYTSTNPVTRSRIGKLVSKIYSHIKNWFGGEDLQEQE